MLTWLTVCSSLDNNVQEWDGGLIFGFNGSFICSRCLFNRWPHIWLYKYVPLPGWVIVIYIRIRTAIFLIGEVSTAGSGCALGLRGTGH